MPSASHRKLVWLIGQEFKQNKKSLMLAAFLVVAFILLCFLRTKRSAELTEGKNIVKEGERLEEELNDLGDDRPANAPTENLERAFNAILHCLVHENDGVMDRRCIKVFKDMLPGPPKRKEEWVKCAVNSFKECTRRPKKDEFSRCVLAFNSCIIDVNSANMRR
ncbi:uncharacterized protein LOC141879864 [Acropora palmata]|uniref:uncharacterized protein LOC141879864 n=1 Tax=Acropora palmata TaxID=6131 RepID=UPI003DA139B6